MNIKNFYPFGGCLGILSILTYFLLESDFHFISGLLFGVGIGYATGLIGFRKKKSN